MSFCQIARHSWQIFFFFFKKGTPTLREDYGPPNTGLPPPSPWLLFINISKHLLCTGYHAGCFPSYGRSLNNCVRLRFYCVHFQMRTADLQYMAEVDNYSSSVCLLASSCWPWQHEHPKTLLFPEICTTPHSRCIGTLIHSTLCQNTPDLERQRDSWFPMEGWKNLGSISHLVTS